jgi:hypothetical protein
LTQYVGILSEGGLIPYDVLDKIATEESGLGQQPKDFGLPAGRRLTDEIARAWSDAQDYWHIFQRRTASLPESETGTTLTRKWVSDLLNEQLLGYELTYQPSGAVISGKNYPISHRAGSGEESPPIQIEGFRTDLDRRPEGRRLSPQALVQEYLNNSDSHLWGIVTNGFLLRLLRDTSRTSRPSYLEFDLQSILDGNRFNEFALFYRVCHRTRLPRTAEDSTSCWLEKYFQLSIEQGGRVRDKLRDGVEDALKTLGTGFLRHPTNEALRERVKAGTLTAADFHRQLLRLVYRLLFLMVAEERRMIVPEGPEADRRQNLFDRYYSVGRLRNLAEKAIEPSTFGDLWIGLQRTFTLFEDGDSNPLGIPPLNGDLFSTLAVKDLQGTHLYNNALLAAIGRLSLFEDHRVRQRVNYSALDVEELGSVYESLLDFQPVFTEQAEGLIFELRTGSERKSTGSYYTRPELVRELIESALVPVMQDRLASAKDSDPAKDKEKKQQAILSMSVCDPACGSGHFLLAAARRLGRELARVKTGEEEPTPKEFHLSVREVISHCVHGVDVNPLAVDLCKLALWLEGHWTGKPLSFLDHRIKCGNSLIGVLDPSVLKDGIPDDAFTAVTGDDKKVASAFKKKNKDERKGQSSLSFDAAEHVHHFAAESARLLGIVEDTPSDVRRKEEIYRKAREQREWLHDWTAANLWTAAFFVPFAKYDDPAVPTHEPFMEYLLHGKDRPQMTGAANALSVERHFFHWRLEFPDVFEKGGFDVVLGNPPWEAEELIEKEFFANLAPHIATVRTKAKRAALIADLETATPRLFLAWKVAVRQFNGRIKFLRDSGAYPLGSSGKLNTYRLFAELAAHLVAPRGRSAQILKSGIVSAQDGQKLFGSWIKQERVVEVREFINTRQIFPDIVANERFCWIVITGSGEKSKSATYAFALDSVDQAADLTRLFSALPGELEILNPADNSVPPVSSQRDYRLVLHIHRSTEPLRLEEQAFNPWSVHYSQGHLNSASDSGLFADNTLEQLQSAGAVLDDKQWLHRDNEIFMPLYEGKFIAQFNHRFSSFAGVPVQNRFGVKAEAINSTSSQLGNPSFEIQSRYWLAGSAAEECFSNKGTQYEWLFGFRDVCRAIVDARTVQACVMPRLPCLDGVPLLVFEDRQREEAAQTALLFNALWSSFAFDYVARQKIHGAHLTKAIAYQMPVPTCAAFDRDEIGKTYREFIGERSLELTVVSYSLLSFARDVGFDGPPFLWDEQRRFLLRCELDAAFFHLYLPTDVNGEWRIVRGQTAEELSRLKASFERPRDAVDYIMESFPIVKRKDQERFDGDYRTKAVILEIYDAMAQAIRSKRPYDTRLDPFPGSPRRCRHVTN